jgi:hypothetical protein
VREAPTFMEWSTMVVPTYPEGGSPALQVCQHHGWPAARKRARMPRVPQGGRGARAPLRRSYTAY